MDIARYLLLLLFLVVISACGPKKTLIRGDLSLLYKGASDREVFSIVGVPARCTLQPVGDASMRIDIYTIHAPNYFGNYYLLYVNHELRFWGYPYEFSRSSNRLIHKAGLMIAGSPQCPEKRTQ